MPWAYFLLGLAVALVAGCIFFIITTLNGE